MTRAMLIAFAAVALVLATSLAACRDYDRFLFGNATDGFGDPGDLASLGGDLGCRSVIDFDGGYTAPAVPLALSKITYNPAIYDGASPSYPVSAVVAGDFDGDGVTDLVATGILQIDPPADNPGTNTELSVLQGRVTNGKRAFDPAARFLENNVGTLIATGDLDGDGRSELLLAQGSLLVGNFAVNVEQINIQGPALVPVQQLPLPLPAPPALIRLEDVDRDGHPDLVVLLDYSVLSSGSDDAVRSYWGGLKQARQVFSTSATGYTELGNLGANISLLTIADLDGNCATELVVGSSQGTLRVIDVDQMRKLTLEQLGAPAWTGTFAAITSGDFDGDGRDEVFIMPDNGLSTPQRLMAHALTAPGQPRFTVKPIALPAGASTPIAIDFDGDKITDLLCWYADGNVALIRGSNAMLAPVLLTTQAGDRPSYPYVPLVLDLQLDGKRDIVFGAGAVPAISARIGQ